MTQINHEKYARKALAALVEHIKKFKNGEKYLTYGQLAKQIDYPEPHRGSVFGRNIGNTLGVMGHLFEDVKIDDWQGRIPYIQAIVVSSNTKLPSDGLKEFNPDYPNLSKEKKKDYVKQEYKKIFQFGERWDLLLEKLHIKENTIIKRESKSRYNPFGNEGSPEHRNLRDYIKENPGYINVNFDIEEAFVEYPLKSGDSIDVVFKSDNRILGVEVKSIRSGLDDLERGIFQCVKYREVLRAEAQINKEKLEINCILVYEGEMDKRNVRNAEKLMVEIQQVNYNEFMT